VGNEGDGDEDQTEGVGLDFSFCKRGEVVSREGTGKPRGARPLSVSATICFRPIPKIGIATFETFMFHPKLKQANLL
jgi:hypothetical protein